MIPVAELERLAAERLDDARALEAAARYDGAAYLAGYAVEFAVKARICRTLDWSDFTTTHDYRSLKTHNFEVLLRFSGAERKMKDDYGVEWSTVKTWTPELRYDHTRSATARDAQQMLEAADTVLKALR